MPNDQPVFRFAPSPNGYLHLGHAYSALFTQAMAQRFGGRLLLRIEDIDTTRSRPEYEAAILDDLAWLGLNWEPQIRRQSEHFAFYAGYLDQLAAMDVIYPCFATRREIAQAVADLGAAAVHDPDGGLVYPGLYRGTDKADAAARIEAGDPYALRFDMRKALALAESMLGGPVQFRQFAADGMETAVPAEPLRWGDIVLARKDIPASYHLAVVADDALQGITHITRGEDLRFATDIHRVLQVLLKLPEPVYCHHQLITDGNGRKLSKSHRDKSLQSLRKDGMTRDAVIQLIRPERGSLL